MTKQMNRQRLEMKGPPCPRCTRLMAVFEHREITAKLLRQQVYYSRWYRCVNSGCKTTLVMPPEFKVQRIDIEGPEPDAVPPKPDVVMQVLDDMARADKVPPDRFIPERFTGRR